MIEVNVVLLVFGVDCLRPLDRASFEEINTLVRLERKSSFSGHAQLDP